MDIVTDVGLPQKGPAVLGTAAGRGFAMGQETDLPGEGLLGLVTEGEGLLPVKLAGSLGS